MDDHGGRWKKATRIKRKEGETQMVKLISVTLGTTLAVAIATVCVLATRQPASAGVQCGDATCADNQQCCFDRNTGGHYCAERCS
jgi:hypothetical protein